MQMLDASVVQDPLTVAQITLMIFSAVVFFVLTVAFFATPEDSSPLEEEEWP